MLSLLPHQAFVGFFRIATGAANTDVFALSPLLQANSFGGPFVSLSELIVKAVRPCCPDASSRLPRRTPQRTIGPAYSM